MNRFIRNLRKQEYRASTAFLRTSEHRQSTTSSKKKRADHKVLGEDCGSRHNHRYAVVVQDLATQCCNRIRAKPNLLRRRKRVYKRLTEPTAKPKVVYSDESWQFGKACVELSCKHCTSPPDRSETEGIAERAARITKDGTSAVQLQSLLDEQWWAGSMECFFCLLKFKGLLSDGKTPHELRFWSTIYWANNSFRIDD